MIATKHAEIAVDKRECMCVCVCMSVHVHVKNGTKLFIKLNIAV